MQKQKTKAFHKVLIVLLTLVIIYCAVAIFPRGDNHQGVNPLINKNNTLMIAHGGGNLEFPDNTLEACYNAYSVSKDFMLELDVNITKDGVLILSHDTTLDYRTDHTGKIEDWNYTDLVEKQVDFSYLNSVTVVDGYRCLVEGSELKKYTDYNGKQVDPYDVDYTQNTIPRHTTKFLVTTLEDVYKAFPDSFINVEIKQAGETGMRAYNEAIRLSKKYSNFDKVVYATKHEDISAEFASYKKQNQAFMYSGATKSVTTFVVTTLFNVDLFYFDNISVLQIPLKQSGIELATKKIVDTAHKHNIACHYWTIDNKETMEYLLSIGADGIMTNRPRLLAGLVI